MPDWVCRFAPDGSGMQFRGPQGILKAEIQRGRMQPEIAWGLSALEFPAYLRRMGRRAWTVRILPATGARRRNRIHLEGDGCAMVIHTFGVIPKRLEMALRDVFELNEPQGASLAKLQEAGRHGAASRNAARLPAWGEKNAALRREKGIEPEPPTDQPPAPPPASVTTEGVEP